MSLRKPHCKPKLARCAKPLKNGADCPVRTGDLMITNQDAALFLNAFRVNCAAIRAYESKHLALGCKPKDTPHDPV